jgi:hypothetical protein
MTATGDLGPSMTATGDLGPSMTGAGRSSALKRCGVLPGRSQPVHEHPLRGGERHSRVGAPGRAELPGEDVPAQGRRRESAAGSRRGGVPLHGRARLELPRRDDAAGFFVRAGTGPAGTRGLPAPRPPDRRLRLSSGFCNDRAQGRVPGASAPVRPVAGGSRSSGSNGIPELRAMEEPWADGLVFGKMHRKGGEGRGGPADSPGQGVPRRPPSSPPPPPPPPLRRRTAPASRDHPCRRTVPEGRDHPCRRTGSVAPTGSA